MYEVKVLKELWISFLLNGWELFMQSKIRLEPERKEDGRCYSASNFDRFLFVFVVSSFHITGVDLSNILGGKIKILGAEGGKK